MKIEAQSRLVMIGDSITDSGRARPVGDGAGSLGSGYVHMVQALIAARYPERRIRVLNTGAGGNTVRHLKERWTTDVIDLKPNWLSVKIGINDVWRQFDRPMNREIHVDLNEYRDTLDALVGGVRGDLHGLVLMSPYFIEPNREDAMRAKMDAYGAAVRELAEKHGAVFVDTQAAFDHALESVHPMELAGDRIHPNPVGHMILARAFLKAVGYEW